MPKAKAAAPKKSSAKPKKMSAKSSTASSKLPKAKAAAPKAAQAKSGTKSGAKPSVKVASESTSRVSPKAAPKLAAKSPAKSVAPLSHGKKDATSVQVKALAGVVATVAVAATVAAVTKMSQSNKKAAATSAKKPTLKKAPPANAVKVHQMPAAPSSRMTLLKLGFSTKEEAAILAAPHGFKIPDNADEPATLDAQYDFILIFVENITEAEVICASLNPCLRPKGRAWVAWPKGGASDINLDQLSGMVEAEGLQKITSLSLDERWSAVKFMHPKAER